jgi:hypothetical protein
MPVLSDVGRQGGISRLGSALAVVALAVAACSSPKITKAFVQRMQLVDSDRTKVEERIQILRSDCASGLLTEVYCYNGSTWYTDNVHAVFNGWLTEVEDDLVKRKSLDAVADYDADLRPAASNVQKFVDWVDTSHRKASAQTATGAEAGPPAQGGAGGQGAFAAPPIGELIQPISDVAKTVWTTYREGQDADVDNLKAQIEAERFRPFGSNP